MSRLWTVHRVPSRRLGPGLKAGGFRIQKLLGKGGMGGVYLAWQTSMSRKVALKILPISHTIRKELVDRFLNEVRMAVRMEHANIVIAFEAGEDEGVLYLAMAYVRGEALNEVLAREGPMSGERALRIAAKLADGSATLDSRSDMYALGMTLYHMPAQTLWLGVSPPSPTPPGMGGPFSRHPDPGGRDADAVAAVATRRTGADDGAAGNGPASSANDPSQRTGACTSARRNPGSRPSAPTRKRGRRRAQQPHCLGGAGKESAPGPAHGGKRQTGSGLQGLRAGLLNSRQ